MSSPDTEQSNTQTLEYLLGVVVENRDRRCAEVRDNAQGHVNEAIKQVHARVRGRMQRHVLALREKYRERVSAALARNQTLIRQHRQVADKECLDSAWPVLRDALQALWNDPVSRHQWIDAAITGASAKLLKRGWTIEHPAGFSDAEQKRLQDDFANTAHSKVALTACDDIEAGIRIVVEGTVIDATLKGLLQQRAAIEAMLISRIKQDMSNDK